MTKISAFCVLSNFHPIQSFFERITRSVGYDWLFGYTCKKPKKQVLTLFILGGFLLLNMVQLKSAFFNPMSIGHLAINVILYSAGSYSSIVTVMLAKYSKEFRRLVDWCGGLYTNKVDGRIAHIRDKLFKECAGQVYLFLRYFDVFIE